MLGVRAKAAESRPAQSTTAGSCSSTPVSPKGSPVSGMHYDSAGEIGVISNQDAAYPPASRSVYPNCAAVPPTSGISSAASAAVRFSRQRPILVVWSGRE